MRITDDMQGIRSLLTGHVRAVFDEQTSNTASPENWINKQRIQFGASVGTRQDGRKPNDCAAPLRHKYSTSGYLFERQLDGIGVGEKSIAIPGIRKRCAQLQFFKQLLF